MMTGSITVMFLKVHTVITGITNVLFPKAEIGTSKHFMGSTHCDDGKYTCSVSESVEYT